MRAVDLRNSRHLTTDMVTPASFPLLPLAAAPTPLTPFIYRGTPVSADDDDGGDYQGGADEQDNVTTMQQQPPTSVLALDALFQNALDGPKKQLCSMILLLLVLYSIIQTTIAAISHVATFSTLQSPTSLPSSASDDGAAPHNSGASLLVQMLLNNLTANAAAAIGNANKNTAAGGFQAPGL